MRIKSVKIDSFGAVNGYYANFENGNITLIYGDNEAGKTTVSEFIRGTLFNGRNAKYPVQKRTDRGYVEVTMEDGRTKTLVREGRRVSSFLGSPSLCGSALVRRNESSFPVPVMLTRMNEPGRHLDFISSRSSCTVVERPIWTSTSFQRICPVSKNSIFTTFLSDTVTMNAPFSPVSLAFLPWVLPGYTMYGSFEIICAVCLCPIAQ